MYSRSLLKLKNGSSSIRPYATVAPNATATTVSSNNYKSYDEIPGPKQYPILGSMLSVKGFGNISSLMESYVCKFLLLIVVLKEENMIQAITINS